MVLISTSLYYNLKDRSKERKERRGEERKGEDRRGEGKADFFGIGCVFGRGRMDGWMDGWMDVCMYVCRDIDLITYFPHEVFLPRTYPLFPFISLTLPSLSILPVSSLPLLFSSLLP